MLVGVTHTDTAATAAKLAAKIWTLRILADERSASTSVRRCWWSASSPCTPTPRRGVGRPGARRRRDPVSEPLVEAFVVALRRLGAEVATGVFGADMQVGLVNDGPVTVVLDAD